MSLMSTSLVEPAAEPVSPAAALTKEVTAALKASFTDAVKTVYFWGLFVVGLGFIVTLFLPELTLRGRADMETGAKGEGTSPGKDGRARGADAHSADASRPESVATDKEP